MLDNNETASDNINLENYKDSYINRKPKLIRPNFSSLGDAMYWAMAQNLSAGKRVQYRVLISAKPDPELIRKFDKMLGDENFGNGDCYVQVFKKAHSWKRKNPVIINFYREPKTEELEQIINAAKEYVRGEEEFVTGETISKGIALEKIPGEYESQQLIAEAQQLDPELELVTRGDRYNSPESLMLRRQKRKLTPVEFYSLRILMDKIKEKMNT